VEFYEEMNEIEVVQDHVQWQGLICVVLNLWGSLTTELINKLPFAIK
jgi:hypothetical protein